MDERSEITSKPPAPVAVGARDFPDRADQHRRGTTHGGDGRSAGGTVQPVDLAAIEASGAHS